MDEIIQAELEWENRRRLREDFNDEQREASGHTNKMYRFHNPADIPGTPQYEQKQSGSDTYFRRWWDSLTREQRMAHLRTRIDSLSIAITAQIDTARREDDRAAEALQDIRDRAATLQDGTKVYRTEDTTAAYTDDGQALTDDQKNDIDWQNKPSWEDRLRAGYNRQQSADRLDRLNSLNNRLGRHREALDDDLSDDDLDGIRDDLDAISRTVTPEKTGLSARFSTAHDDVRENIPAASRSLTPDVTFK